ncbi:DUF4404 family protein [Pseudomaricurvus alkylphenolicus]|jgi:hypothetical protein|uniref:DUF4404 family protein n=1 Tax=Pseudomaricurvus alkylphenolicus TaxID=1306991 RepID=UPI0014231543|nr:DUF4404 family protein [Pseudomaricurvus alkylphenolicus]NIB43971.1 DUF4404 family protein [Pseudomaricurvus alkylphenolicus]
MTEDQLRASIAEVRALMHTALDSKEKDLLGDIMESISRGHAEEHSQDHADTISQQLDTKAVEFESKHPKLARAIREVMDSLNKMGV